MIIWCRACHNPMHYRTPARSLLAMPSTDRITCGKCSIDEAAYLAALEHHDAQMAASARNHFLDLG